MSFNELFGNETRSTRLINCLPHVCTVVVNNNMDTITIEKSGVIARCVEIEEDDGNIPIPVTDAKGNKHSITVPVKRRRYGEVFGLPEPEEDTYYLVSYPVAAALPERSDLLVPDDMLRQDGRIVGCRKFSRYGSDMET
jgi:hypothetical protein